MKKIGIICLGLLASANLLAQNEALFEQYVFNQLSVNPGYAGSKGALELTAMANRQWAKLEEAPATESVFLHTSLANGKVGLGGRLLHDAVGPTEKLQVAVDYAYRIHTQAGVLSLGLEASASMYNLNFANLDAFLDGDPTFTQQPTSFTSFNAGAGLWFQNNKLFAGLSVPQLIEANDANTADASTLAFMELFDQSRHAYISAGYLIRITDQVSLQPRTMARYDFQAPLVADAGLSLVFDNRFWLGGSYRTSQAISVMGEYFFDFSNTLRTQWLGIGYAYNQRMDDVQNVFGSTHEVFVTLQWDKKTTRFTSPRFF